MRNLFLFTILIFMTSSCAFAVPDNIQVGEPTFTIYDSSYNIALRNKLEANYDKKYLHVNKDGSYGYYDGPLNSYEKEVVIPYALNKKTDNYKIIKKY